MLSELLEHARTLSDASWSVNESIDGESSRRATRWLQTGFNYRSQSITHLVISPHCTKHRTDSAAHLARLNRNSRGCSLRPKSQRPSNEAWSWLDEFLRIAGLKTTDGKTDSVKQFSTDTDGWGTDPLGVKAINLLIGGLHPLVRGTDSRTAYYSYRS